MDLLLFILLIFNFPGVTLVSLSLYGSATVYTVKLSNIDLTTIEESPPLAIIIRKK
jgi:hypothetical protein